MFRFLLLGVLSCISFCLHLTAQVSTPHPDSEVSGESRDFRSVRSGRWLELTTWQVWRSGVWVVADRNVGVPNATSNVFIEAGHTIIATRANIEATEYNGAQGLAFLDVNNLHIHTNASITTTWGSVEGGFTRTDWYNGDRYGGYVSTRISGLAQQVSYEFYRFGNQDTTAYIPPNLDTYPKYFFRPRNMELRIYGKLRYYSGSAADRSDHDARIQVTAATIGTGSTLVFRGTTRVITQAHEWSTTLATQTGYFDNTAHTASMLASNPPERHANFRGLMGRNSFWTAIFDLGRFNDRNFSTDQFTGPTDDPSTAVGTLQGTFTAGIVQVRRGTLRVEAPALLVNEGSVTSGVLHVMNNAVLQMVSGNVGRTGVYAEQFADGSANYLTSTECRVTSRMRYAVVEEGGALEFAGTVGSLSAADVRFNGTVLYSRTGDQTLVQDSPYLSFNPAGPIIAPGLAAGENGLFDPYNNNFNANAGVQQVGDPTSGVLSQFGSSPSGLGVGTAALFQPSTTAAYSHLVLRGIGTKFLPVTTVTISRALILQGEARLGLQNLAYPGVPVSAGNASAAPVLPYYLSQAHGGELRANQSASKAGYFPPLVYLRSTGLTGFREENNIGTTLRTSLSTDGTESTPWNVTPQPLWSAYGGNTDPVAFVGFTTASTRLILYDQALYPEGASFPVGITLSASTNREQMDMTPSVKAPVIHGLPAEPSYLPANSANARHGYTARGLFYGDAPQALDGARFGQVIRQTLNRVNGTQTSTTPMQKPLAGVQNFVNGFPVITNSLYDAPINSTATTTLQYDSEWDAMSQIEFPRGVWGAHNVVINSASNVTQTLPQRTADFQPASGNGVNWGVPHLNFANASNALTGATAGTLIAGPEHVMTANGHLPRHAFDPRTGLYQPNAVYNETANGADSITPGTLASAYIDTRPDVGYSATKINDQYYTTGVGLRPSVSLTGTFDGRTRAGFPQGLVNAPSVFGTTQTITTTAPNDFGRRGDFNNFGTLELRRGNVVVPNSADAPTYAFTLSSTAIISSEQANITYRGELVGKGNTKAKVSLSEASGAEAYPQATTWNGVGVRFGGDGVGGIVVRGPAGPANVAGVLVMGNRTNLVITGGTGGTIAAASNSPLLRFRAQSSINTGFDELPATLGIPGLEALPPMTNDQSTNDHVTINPAPDPNGFNNAWNLDLPYIRNGIGNLTMLRGTSNILTLVGNTENSGDVSTGSTPELAGLQVFGTIATARGSLDLNGRNIELGGTTSTLVEAFERSPRPSSVINRHTKARAYIGLTSPRAVPLLDSAAAAQLLASGGVPLAASLAGLGATIVNANFNADSTRFRVRRWQTSAANALTRLNAPNVPLANRYWTIETSGTQSTVPPKQSFGLVLNYTDSDFSLGLSAPSIAILRSPSFASIYQALAPENDSLLRRVKQVALLSSTQVIRGSKILTTGNFTNPISYPGTDPLPLPDRNNPFNPFGGFERWSLSVPAPVSLVLRGQRFGGRFGDPIGAGFEGASMDIVGFPPPFGAAWQGGGISRQAANDFGAIIGPFKAGVPTCATIIGEVLDDLGNVAQFAPSTGASLVVGQVSNGTLGPWNTGVPLLFSGTSGYPEGKIGAVSRGGRFEWTNVRLDGVASTTVTLTLTNDLVDEDGGVPRPNPAPRLGYADPQPAQVSLQGGFPFSVTFATQNANNTGAVRIYPGAQGPFAVPGCVACIPGWQNSGYDGSILTNLVGVPIAGIVVGQTVTFPYTSPSFSSITGIVKDRFGNYASFSTEATISIAGGWPPVDQQRTPLVGQVSESQLVWGLGNLGNESGLARVINNLQPDNQSASRTSPALAPTGSGYPPFNNPQLRTNLVSFPNFQIWGATSSNVTLVMSSNIYDPIAISSCGGGTSATIHIVPGPAVGVAPVIVPDVYNRNQPDRMPSKMFIGASNRGNPSTWFYVQAVDQFGNRVDNGPNAYNGGTANIRFFSPEEGLPKNTSGTFQFTTTTPRDPYVRPNNQRYTARGTSAPAINGLYTFNDFTPLGPASLEALGRDVVLTFEDERLQGERAPLASGATGLFRPIPPITTATTTFVPSAASLVLRGQRFGGRFGDPIGAGFEGASMDIVGFPPPFGAAWQGGGISRQAANDFGAIIGPFKAGVPTCATIIGEVLDELGNVAQFAPSTGAALVVGQVSNGTLGPWNTGVPLLFSGTSGYPGGKIGAVSRGGRFEWTNVRLDGIASTTVTLTLANDIVDSATNRITPNPAPRLGYGDPQPVQVSLQGGFPFSATFATQNVNNSPDVLGKIYPGAEGPFAVPGAVAWCYYCDTSRATGYAGSTSYIEVGKTVVLPYSAPGYSSITCIVKDRFGNYASFPTVATISISGGSPPVDQQRTPLLGQVSEQKLVWGLGNLGNESGFASVTGSIPSGLQSASRVSPALAPTGAGYAPYTNPQVQTNIVSFPNFQIWGATSSTVGLYLSIFQFEPCFWCESAPSSYATITIVPGPAVSIAPVIVPDVYNRNQFDRMPSKMFIGASNRGNPSTWFYVQAVDQFGNRVDNGPNAYNGGTANIRFFSPEEGLPKNTSGTFQFTTTTPRDPYVRANNQRYTARGTSAPAINGLYTFNDFTPLGPASLEALGKDVVLTFEDERLQGVRAPFASGATGLFRPIPPITTATTTFVQPPVLTLSASDSVLNGARKAAPNALFLRERARTYQSTQNALETGFVRLTRPVTTMADPTLNVQYSLDYFNATNGFDTTTFRISDRARLTPLPLAGTTTLPLPSAIILPDGLPSPALFPPMPQPVPTTINGLQGDLAPLAVGASGLSTAALGTSGTIAFESGALSQNVRFSARFSDQTYPRNPARQGVRLAVMRLLADTTLPYHVESGADSVFVVLADPASAAPLCINPLADKLYLMTGTGSNTIQETLELEPPAWHTTTQSGGRPAPAWVFYDDNYDALQYAASSSDTTLVRVSVNAVDMRFSGRPTLNYAIQPFAPSETSATITVTASDGSAQVRDTFLIAMRRPVGVEVESEQSASSLRAMSLSAMRLNVMPNPTHDDETFAELLAPTAGILRLRLLNVLGAVIWQADRSVQALEGVRELVPMGTCAAGVYVLEARLGGMRSVTRVVKE
jgi:hypothetical protein